MLSRSSFVGRPFSIIALSRFPFLRSTSSPTATLRYPSSSFFTMPAATFTSTIVATGTTAPASRTAQARAMVVPPEDLASFSEHLEKSTYILALLGAGLSASSGLPTFRGAGGVWRCLDSTQLATPDAFQRDPGLVWQFYSHRRHLALKARPNPAHFALADLARKRGGFLTLSQNVDGLSPRAGHPPLQLELLHGSLFDIKCSEPRCGFKTRDFSDPITPALAIPTAPIDAIPSVETSEVEGHRRHTQHPSSSTKKPSDTSNIHQPASYGQPPTPPSSHYTDSLDLDEHRHPDQTYLDISDLSVPIRRLSRSDLPACPSCRTGLLRPGVVWFGETLPSKSLQTIDDWIWSAPQIDLMMVIGTSASVFPAAEYIDKARDKGARVAVVNMDRDDEPASGMREGKDWFFEGDAAAIVPEILRCVIGDASNVERG